MDCIKLNTKKEEGYVGVDTMQKEMIGKQGTAFTDLRPSGKVEIEDETYDAKSEVGFISRGEKVKVIDYRSGQLYVMKVV